MKVLPLLIAATAVSGCISVVPNDSASANRARVIESREPVTVSTSNSTAPSPQGTPTRVSIEPQPSQQTIPAGNQPVQASPDNPAPQIVTTNSDGSISDEQDFDAVSSRQSIESDAQRIEQNRSQYVVIEPTDLPSRGQAAPNIVAYALRTNNPVGAKLYSRSRFVSKNAHIRGCSKFPTSDMAQQAFLSRGGPIRDPLKLDPDGDGFACGWDPSPFRQAVQN